MTIRRYDRDYHSVAVITDDDEEELAFCEVCQKNGELSKLKERLYLDTNGKLLPPPPNADLFRQCWTCGTVVKLRDVKLSGTITGINGVDILENPLDQGKGIVLGLDNTKQRYQKLRKQKNKHPDKEIQRMLEDGYELKNYQTDADTLH
jgi:hypothetical protein